MPKRWAVCEVCGLVVEAEEVDVAIGIVGFYHHCGYGHECCKSELYTDMAAALRAAARLAETSKEQNNCYHPMSDT